MAGALGEGVGERGFGLGLAGAGGNIAEQRRGRAEVGTLGYPSQATIAFLRSNSVASYLRDVRVPTLLVHPTADTEIRVRQANEIVANAGADDVTYVEMKGAPHYLEGHRPQALAHVAEWMAARFP